jgi:UDP-glucose 4-epimerase
MKCSSKLAWSRGFNVPDTDRSTSRVLTSGVSVLVTGGEGFLGSRIVQRLLLLGCDVTSVDNLSNARDLEDTITSNVHWDRVRADIRDRSAMEETFQRALPRFVFHLAALHFIPACIADPVATLEINAIGTQIVLDACAQLRTPPVLVLASTADVYEPTIDLLAESSVLGPNNVYGLSKLTAEGLTRIAGASKSCEPVICRLFNLYGAYETNPHVIPEIVRQLRSSDDITLGNTKPKRDFVYVHDAAAALIALGQGAPIGSTVNVGTGRSYSIDDVISTISEITGRDIHIATDPDRWRPTDRQNLQCDPKLLRSIVPEAVATSLIEGLRALLIDEGLLS